MPFVLRSAPACPLSPHRHGNGVAGCTYNRGMTSSLPAAAEAKGHITAVLFDYGQVLSQGPNAAAWERFLTILDVPHERLHAAYWEPRHPYDRGDLDGAAYWTRVAQLAGRPGVTEAELDELYAADVDLWTDLNMPMLAWAQQLQDRGVRTGILSNIGDRMETGIRARFDWIGRFDHCTWSHRLNLAKPEAAIYQHAATGLGVAPAQVLFIDDRADNIAAAREVGMQAIEYSHTDHAAFERRLHALHQPELLPGS